MAMKTPWAGLCVLALWLSGCGPVYETQYVPPPDAEGKNCSFNCENNRQICRQACKLQYDDCLRVARMDAHEDYLREKERYLDKKDDCLRDTRRDDRKNDQEENGQDVSKDENDCSRRAELGKEPCRNYDKKANKKDDKKDTKKDAKKHEKDCNRLSEPSMNTYAYDHRCDSYCGCDDDFNRCFQICGGKVIRRCVEGCQ
jgi:hypothetical protein